MKIDLSFKTVSTSVYLGALGGLVLALIQFANQIVVGTHFLYFFAAAILGHFVGDYLFQNQWMATRKSIKGWPGHVACSIHVALYTLAVAMFTGWHPAFLLAIAIPHWIIDRWSLAMFWLYFKNGYTYHEVWKKAPLCAAPAPDALEQNVWKVAFAAPVYIFNDNTLHWVCIWFTAMYFFGR